MNFRILFNTLGKVKRESFLVQGKNSINVIGIGKQKQKYIQSLHIKKYRQEYGVFLVEGRKSIGELLAVKSRFDIQQLFLTEAAARELGAGDAEVCSESELSKVSFYKTNTFGLAVVKVPVFEEGDAGCGNWLVAVDGIKDPGNLGTIVRTADWYGIKEVWCSHETVDFYSPKVIASTMGSFTRVKVRNVDLTDSLKQNKRPVYGAFLSGGNIHEFRFPMQGILLVGSESHGISAGLSVLVDHRVTIPKFGGAESLNAGIATAVLLDNIVRGLVLEA